MFKYRTESHRLILIEESDICLLTVDWLCYCMSPVYVYGPCCLILNKMMNNDENNFM